jgi:hypothetical protein
MVDVAGLGATPTAGDFTFRVGNDNTPSGWAVVPTAPTISVRAGAGVGGSDRVTLIWPNNAIEKQWLQVTVNASTNTGVRVPSVFYFGNAIGEVGDSPSNARVTSFDELQARLHPRNISNPTDILDPYDFNRDTRVTSFDQNIARINRTTLATTLNLIQVPASLQAGGLASAEDGSLAQALNAPPTDNSNLRPRSLSAQSLSAQSLSAQALSATGLQASGLSTSAFAQMAAESENLPRRASAASAIDGDLLDLLAAGRTR